VIRGRSALVQEIEAIPTRKRAIASIRVSEVGARRGTDAEGNRAKRGTKGLNSTLVSDVMQLNEARRYAEYRDFELDEEMSMEFIDLDQSGSRKSWRKRPGMVRIVEAVRRGEYNVVLFYKVARLARWAKDGLDLLEELDSLGAEIHFVHDNYDFKTSGKMIITIMLAVAEAAADDIGSNVRSTFLTKAEKENSYHGTLPCWLRRVSLEGGAKSYEFTDKADTIRRLIELRCEGKGHSKIAQILNQEGHTTGRDRYWDQGKIHEMLEPHRIDTMLGNGWFARGAEDAIKLVGAFPALISEEEAGRLAMVEDLYSTRKNPNFGWHAAGREGRHSASSQHICSGLARCARCGASMAADKTADGYRMICTRQNVLADLHRPSFGSIAMDSLEDAVLRVVHHGTVLGPAKLPSRVRKAPKQKDVSSQIKDVQAKLAKLLDAYLEGHVAQEIYNAKQRSLRDELDSLVERENSQLMPEFHSEAQAIIAQDVLTRNDLRHLVMLMVERVEVGVTVAGWTVSERKETLRKFVRVTFRYPLADGTKTYLAAVYTGKFSGGDEEKIFFACEDEPDERGLIMPPTGPMTKAELFPGKRALKAARASMPRYGIVPGTGRCTASTSKTRFGSESRSE